MSALPRPDWIDPYAPFEVAFAAVGAPEPVVLRSAPDADRATVVFHDEWERLKADRVVGELLLIYCDEEPRTLLREPLG
jgi:hypothetical protein